ncbi:Translation initiation factor 1A [Pleurotus pulmonarius]|nr:Translation initiation factor 1A [Pleurotus pulmonarius]
MASNSTRLRAMALYKELHRLGRDYPDPSYDFQGRVRRMFEKNRHLTEKDEIEDALKLGEYIKKGERHISYRVTACFAQPTMCDAILLGGKNRRRGKNENDDDKRELVFREDGQEYAQVIKMLGNGRLEAQCFDGEKRLAHIRGKMRKKVWINQGDIVLLSLRDFQDNKADVIVKYTADEARNLKAYGELPENAKINETDTFGEEEGECTFEFGEDGEIDVDDI